MKKILSTIALLAIATMSFVSCDKNEVEAPATGVKMKTITVKTDIATKTTLDSNHENLVWSEDDKISIFNDIDNQNYEAAYVAGGDLTVEVPETTKEIYAHYPYYEGNESGPEVVSIFITKNQKQTNPGELNGYNYPMVAKGTVSADNKALISLYPVASALALNIYHTGVNGVESVKSVTVTPAAANTKFTGSQTTNLKGDDITYTEAASSDPITVTLTNALVLGNTKPTDKQKFGGQIYVCLAKQSYANVKFEIQTDKGTYTIPSNDTPFDCVNNDFVPVNINLAKASFKEAEAPVDPTAYSWELVKDNLSVGDKVVIAASASSVAMSTTQNNNNRGQIAVEKSDDNNALTANANVQVFEVVSGSVSSSFAFKCLNGEEKGKYIAAASSSSNNMHSNASIDANASWDVTINSSTGVAEVVAKGSYSRNTLQHNSNSKLFSCYSSASQAAVVFYRAGLPAPELSFPEASYSVNIGETFTAPTLTNPSNVTVTYSSSNDAIAAVDASTGAVSVGTTAGTATITASFAGNSSYSANSASYTLSVIDSSVELYTIDFSEKGYSNAESVTTVNGTGPFTIVFDNGTNATNPPKYYTSGTAVRMYDGNTLTVSSTLTIIGITFEFDSESNNISASKGTYEGTTWAGEETSIVFTSNGGQSRIKKMTISYKNDGSYIPPTVTGISVEDYTATYTESTSATYAFDGKVYVVYSDESKMILGTDEYSIDGSVDMSTPDNYTLTISATVEGTVYSKQIVITVEEGASAKSITFDLSSSTTGNTSTSYVTSATSFTVDGITFEVNNWNPSTGQVRGNQGNASAISTNNFQLRNTSALPGNIKSITFTTQNVSSTYTYAKFGSSSAITSCSTSDVQASSGTNSISWTRTGSEKYFFVGMAKGGTSGTGKITSITIVYE